MGSGHSRDQENNDVPEIAALEELDRVENATVAPQLGGGSKKRTRNYTVKSKQKRRQTRRQK